MGLPKFDDDNFEANVLQSNVPVLVDFYTEWCQPCKRLAPVIEELAASYTDRVKMGKLDVDEAPKTATQYGVMGVPTLILFKGGEAKETIVGVVPKATLEGMIAKHI